MTINTSGIRAAFCRSNVSKLYWHGNRKSEWYFSNWLAGRQPINQLLQIKTSSFKMTRAKQKNSVCLLKNQKDKNWRENISLGFANLRNFERRKKNWQIDVHSHNLIYNCRLSNLPGGFSIGKIKSTINFFWQQQ